MSDSFLNNTAEELDAADELRSFRSEFRLPIFEAVGADLVEASKGACSALSIVMQFGSRS